MKKPKPTESIRTAEDLQEFVRREVGRRLRDKRYTAFRRFLADILRKAALRQP